MPNDRTTSINSLAVSIKLSIFTKWAGSTTPKYLPTWNKKHIRKKNQSMFKSSLFISTGNNTKNPQLRKEKKKSLHAVYVLASSYAIKNYAIDNR